MQIITVAITKGGTGKTTTSAALAQAAKHDGQKVLAIDLDPQCNLSFFIGADTSHRGSYELFEGVPAADLIQQTRQGIDVLSASPNLATLTTYRGSAKRLQNALEPIKGSYNLIIIDTPPTMGELHYNALQGSTGLIIPLETDGNSLQGLYQITDVAKQMQTSNPELKITGVILTKFDPWPKINRHYQQAIIDAGQRIGAPYLSAIRAGISIREAQALQTDLYSYAPTSKPATDYIQLYKIIKECRA